MRHATIVEPAPEATLAAASGSAFTTPPASDARLGDEVAARVARPKRAPADSFVLHAPLELLARMALLPLVRPDARGAARERLAALGTQYAAAGDEVGEPCDRAYDRAEHAAAELVAAIAAGEEDDADAAAAWLAAHLDAESLVRALADDVVPRLAAAAHGSIFLYHLPRVAPRSAAVARTSRGLVRELVRERAWRLGWYRDAARDGSVPALTADTAGAVLNERLLGPPCPGDPGSNFIYPTMHLVEQSGLAAELLDAPTRALDPAGASRVLGRVAAWSMLQDDAAHAPYGWSHALSMPQATLGVARACRDPNEAIAVAATYVLGFRATLGRVRLDPSWTPARPAPRDWLAALDGTPDDAVAAAWSATPATEPRIVEALATRASLHHDAHLVKYTLACLDARRADPEMARLFLASAAYLSAWWRLADAGAAR
jgi:hypothetical protein